MPHPRPVLDRSTDVGQHPCQTCLDRFEFGRFGAPVHLDVDQRFVVGTFVVFAVGKRLVAPALVADHRHHRVDDEVQGETLAIQFHADRVDQEGHVLADDLDHGVGRFPAMFVEPGVERADANAAAVFAHEVPVAGHRAVEILCRTVDQVFRIDLGKVPGGERSQYAGLLLRHAFMDEGQYVGEQFPGAIVDVRRHGGSPFSYGFAMPATVWRELSADAGTQHEV